MKHSKFTFTALLPLLLFSIQSNADEIRTSPLTLQQVNAEEDQTFSLLQIKSIHFPQSVSTVGDAVDYLLHGTGYKQAHPASRSEQDQLLMNRLLADSQRSYSQVSLINVLHSLSGIGFDPIVDPVNYLVAFGVSSEYRK